MRIWRKKSKPITMAEVAERLRGFMLDSQLQNGHELAVYLGCTPLSNEVQEKEEQESDKRTDRISYLIPMIFAQAHAMAEASVALQRTMITAEPISEETWKHSRMLIEQVTMSTLLGSISQLVDMGLLEVPRKKRK